MLLRSCISMVVPMEYRFVYSGCFLILSWIFLTSFKNAGGFKTSTAREPLTANAFNFFDPMTAPMPVLPLTLFPLDTMVAYKTQFSPAGPMAATCME